MRMAVLGQAQEQAEQPQHRSSPIWARLGAGWVTCLKARFFTSEVAEGSVKEAFLVYVCGML